MLNWDERITQLQRVIDIFIKAEIHALIMVGVGASMCLHGNKDEGQLIIGAGLAVFRGGKG
jgi:hypothetical protein